MSPSENRGIVYQQFLTDLAKEYGPDVSKIPWAQVTLLYSYYLLHHKILPKESINDTQE